MPDLPITQVLPEIKYQLTQNNRLILQAPPGAGKTTLVPLALLDQPWLQDKQIIMLEPRRLATHNAAARMAHLLGEKVGETVGYQIRQDRCFSKRTRILVVTEGILTRKLQADPELDGIALVIFDEFHERNINADLSLAFCLQSQEILNEDLKIMLMSATLNTQELVTLLEAPLISSLGKSFPVDIIHQAENTSPLNHYTGQQHNLLAMVTQKTIEAVTMHQGNILIFLPGVREIKQLEYELLQAFSQNKPKQAIHISPLYGDLSKQQQLQAICAPPPGQRKIVLSTNIAETSLTIEGINVVIDSGLQRASFFNPGSGMNSLQTTLIAQDSATQRSGRAGRLSAGTCYRLWSKSQHKRLPAHQNAEILRSDLAPVILELAQWGIQEVDELHWLDRPPPGATAQAKELLFALQAIDDKGRITQHGQKMLALSIHPRLAHMVLKAQSLQLVESESLRLVKTKSLQLIESESLQLVNTKSLQLVELSCLLVALLTEKDFLKGQKTSDLAYRISLLQQIKQQQPGKNSQRDQQLINKNQGQYLLKIARELQQRLVKSTGKTAHQEHNSTYENDMTGVLLAFAYPDRIAKLRQPLNNDNNQRYLLSNNKGAFFSYQDILANEPFLVIPNLNEQTKKHTKEARIFLAASISLAQLEEYFSQNIVEKHQITWNKKLQKVESLNKTMLGSLVLKERNNTSLPGTQKNSFLIQSALLQGVKGLGLQCLPWSKQAYNLQQRVQFIRYQQEKNISCHKLLSQIKLPDFSDNFLLNHLEQWLQPHLNKENSIKHLQSLDIHQILNSSLDWGSLQQLNELAPETIQVPSGSRIRIDYSDAEAPVLAVRLQELFGLQSTPAVIKNSHPLLLHLLSPASRPMQVTHDLASFWKNTYNEVKKELRGKYKKHYWPDDPLQAQATSRAKPRKS